jgi:hypothetical protein
MNVRRSVVISCVALCLLPRIAGAQDTPPAAAAPDEARVQLALQLLELTDMRKQMDSAMSTVLNAQLAGAVDALRKSGMPEAEVQKQHAQLREIPGLIMAEVGWDVIARDAAVIQASVFTADELRAMIAFYESPAGRAWVARAPEMMTRMTEVTQKRLALALPKILELLKKRMQQ